LLTALRDVGGLTAPGRLSFHSQVLQLLKNRLLLTDLVARHPEIPEIDLAPPVIIAGLPRTGTTHLHNLLAADPRFRPPPHWDRPAPPHPPTGRAPPPGSAPRRSGEAREPSRRPAGAGGEPAPRRTRTDAAVWFMNTAMPLFPLMHEMTTDHVHEEIALLAIDF